MTFVIHHNPGCGTSRKALARIQEAGHEPVVIPYLKTGWTREQLLGLFAAADLSPRQAMRKQRSAAEELGLLDESVSDEQILAAMVEHPALVERPIVCSPKGVRLCRPLERIEELL
ncbi:MAG: arsenate reductase (glutaredoxin) [Xanthomonadales bacterium]|nr:arsenate reductase (glutaredoxin) [Xanthomonadales bacterium]